MSLTFSEEEMRLLKAASEGRLVTNEHFRWVIEGEKKRPERKARERLKSLKLIDWEWREKVNGRRPTYLVLTPKGRAAWSDALSSALQGTENGGRADG